MTERGERWINSLAAAVLVKYADLPTALVSRESEKGTARWEAATKAAYAIGEQYINLIEAIAASDSDRDFVRRMRAELRRP